MTSWRTTRLFEVVLILPFLRWRQLLVGLGVGSRPKSGACLDATPSPTKIAKRRKGGRSLQAVLAKNIRGHFRCAVKGTFSLCYNTTFFKGSCHKGSKAPSSTKNLVKLCVFESSWQIFLTTVGY